jgi:hypothetical protein
MRQTWWSFFFERASVRGAVIWTVGRIGDRGQSHHDLRVSVCHIFPLPGIPD